MIVIHVYSIQGQINTFHNDLDLYTITSETAVKDIHLSWPFEVKMYFYIYVYIYYMIYTNEQSIEAQNEFGLYGTN